MKNGTDPIIYWIIGLGFVGGYLLVSFVMNKIKGASTSWKSHENPAPPQQGSPAPRTSSAVTSPPPIRPVQVQPIDLEEQRFARILNLELPATPEKLEEACRSALDKYAPEKLVNVAPEIQKLAAERRSEITAAYQFFQARQQRQ